MPAQRRERRQATLHPAAQGRPLARRPPSCNVAWAAGAAKKASYLQAQFQRLRHRRGPKKAICAVAASILTAVYHMLRDGTFYQDLGADHFRPASPEAKPTARPADRQARLHLQIAPTQQAEVVSI